MPGVIARILSLDIGSAPGWARLGVLLADGSDAEVYEELTVLAIGNPEVGGIVSLACDVVGGTDDHLTVRLLQGVKTTDGRHIIDVYEAQLTDSGDVPRGISGSGQEPVVNQVPDRFTIVPDDYHVPYAGTTEDRRKFFLSQELFSPGGSAYVGLFLWNADGSFIEVRVDEVTRPSGLPPGQAGPAGAKALVDARLAELGDYVLEPIEVEPSTEQIDGVTFGWNVGQYKNGTYYVNIEPGNFIAYYEPWNGLDYDT